MQFSSSAQPVLQVDEIETKNHKYETYLKVFSSTLFIS